MVISALYAAVWDTSSGPAWQARHGLTASQYQAAFNQLASQGYRLRMVSGYAPDGEDLYAALWDQSTGPAWQAHHRMTADQYQATFNQLAQQGYRLRTMSGYEVGGQDLYAALWDKDDSVAWQAHHRMTADQYQATFNQLSSQGYRLTWVSTYAVSGEDLYAAIWDKSEGPAWQAHHRMNPSDYQSTFDGLLSQGYRPVCISACNTGGDDLYAALWEQESGSAWVAHHAMTAGGYQYTFDQLLQQGYRLRFVTGFPGAEPALASTGVQMQYQLMKNWCWIAVATAINHYYDPASAWAQCSLATAQLQASASLHMQGQCCPDAQLLASTPGLAQQLANPYSLSSEYALDGVNSQLAATPTGICNHTGDIGKALTQTGNLNRETASVVNISDLLNELSAGRPVCINIDWSGGGSHYIAATGVELPDTVIVEDPIYGPSALPYQTLANSYHGTGSWTDSFYTKA